MEHCSSFMQFKSKILSNQKSDQYFYETMMIFSAKVLQGAFEKSDIPKLEEEINEFQTGTDCIDAQVAKYDTQFSIVNMLLNIHQRITRADIAEFIARQ